MLDAYSRRHEAQKIYLRQQAAQRWIGWRDSVLQGQKPHQGHTAQLGQCDSALRVVSSKLERMIQDQPLITSRSSQLSQTIQSTQTCDHQITKWGAGRLK